MRNRMGRNHWTKFNCVWYTNTTVNHPKSLISSSNEVDVQYFSLKTLKGSDDLDDKHFFFSLYLQWRRSLTRFFLIYFRSLLWRALLNVVVVIVIASPGMILLFWWNHFRQKWVTGLVVMRGGSCLKVLG